jgi:hypothetical protein
VITRYRAGFSRGPSAGLPGCTSWSSTSGKIASHNVG